MALILYASVLFVVSFAQADSDCLKKDIFCMYDIDGKTPFGKDDAQYCTYIALRGFRLVVEKEIITLPNGHDDKNYGIKHFIDLKTKNKCLKVVASVQVMIESKEVKEVTITSETTSVVRDLVNSNKLDGFILEDMMTGYRRADETGDSLQEYYSQYFQNYYETKSKSHFKGFVPSDRVKNIQIQYSKNMFKFVGKIILRTFDVTGTKGKTRLMAPLSVEDDTLFSVERVIKQWQSVTYISKTVGGITLSGRRCVISKSAPSSDDQDSNDCQPITYLTVCKEGEKGFKDSKLDLKGGSQVCRKDQLWTTMETSSSAKIKVKYFLADVQMYGVAIWSVNDADLHDKKHTKCQTSDKILSSIYKQVSDCDNHKKGGKYSVAFIGTNTCD